MATERRRVTREELEQSPLYKGVVQDMVRRLGEGARPYIERVTGKLYGDEPTILLSDYLPVFLQSDVLAEMKRDGYNQE